MVAIQSRQVAALLNRPDPALTLFLVFGPDAGLVSERARALAKAVAGRDSPEGEIIRLDDQDLDADPDRLGVELLTVPMFGGRKVVRVAASRRVNAQRLRALVEQAPLPGTLIVEAEALRADEALRTLFEKSPAAAAIACYPDEADDLESMAREVLRAAGLTAGPDALGALVASLGADRALSRMEVEKLALYAEGGGEVTVEDVEAVVGDAAALATDQIIDAATHGDVRSAVIGVQRLADAGESLQGFMVLLQWHFARLHRVRAAIDAGRSMDEAMRSIRPPLFGRRRAALEAQCRRWPRPAIESALERMRRASLRARVDGALELAHIERLLMELARLAVSARR